VLNGADGLGELAAGLVSQGLTILDSVKKGLNGESQAGPLGPQRMAAGQSPDGDSPDSAG